MTLRDVHQDFSWVPILSNAIVGLWALAAHRFAVLRRRALWWCTGVAQVTEIGRASCRERV